MIERMRRKLRPEQNSGSDKEKSQLSLPKEASEIIRFLDVCDFDHLPPVECADAALTLNERYLDLSARKRKYKLTVYISYGLRLFALLAFILYIFLIDGRMDNLPRVFGTWQSNLLLACFEVGGVGGAMLESRCQKLINDEQTLQAENMLVNLLFRLHSVNGLSAMVQGLYSDPLLTRREMWNQLPSNPYAVLSDVLLHACRSQCEPLAARHSRMLSELAQSCDSVGLRGTNNFVSRVLDYFEANPYGNALNAKNLTRKLKYTKNRDRACKLWQEIQVLEHDRALLLRKASEVSDENTLVHVGYDCIDEPIHGSAEATAQTQVLKP